ncbi:thiamine pyrophosphate-dependent enzyme [uncultured Maricaulis sp.]|uniref:thiamine pyrophosphate-dependent enzyme n=1 Tax=uncultured Maricaulis sp. TaxID=174710 RepID=UPI00261E4843|nr:thiamine pyrophosphate-dependent enzyme [uncultured Maricaulis sp.]
MRVADLLLDILAAHGVQQVYGVPGDAINDFTFALEKRDDMEFVMVRHEEAGAFMASAQAKLTGRMTACMGTSGPGAIHLLNGLYDAKMDHAPVIAITGQAPTKFVGTEYHQEVALERLFSDVAEYTRTVMTPDQLPDVMIEACKAALAGPGVGHIAIPSDISGRSVSASRNTYDLGVTNALSMPCAAALDTASELINQSDRIAILAGIGCADAREELLALSERVGAPIVRSLRAKDVIDEDIEACIGGLGLLGSSPGSAAMAKCDCLLLAGSDFPYIDFFPDDAKIIQIDSAPTRLGRRAKVDAPLAGHCQPTLEALLTRVERKSDRSFYDSMQAKKTEWNQEQAERRQSDATPIAPERVMQELNRIAPTDTIYTVDTGTSTAWAARHLIVTEDQRFTLSGALASMAFAPSGAIGAKFAYPERPVCAISGDGGFAMLMADFITAVRYDKPVVNIVLNNSKLGFIALEQEAKGLPEHAIGLENPDFVAFAKACGGHGVRVEDPDDLAKALRDAFNQTKASLVEIMVDPDALIMPPKISAEQAINFGIAKTREFLG